MDTSINLTVNDSSIGITDAFSESNKSLLDDEQSYIGQQDLYGLIRPSPIKHDNSRVLLPKIEGELVLPKQRKRSHSYSKLLESKSQPQSKLDYHKMKRPSTCGKEGIRNFSTPLPLKIKSLEETSIPSLTPEGFSINDDDNTTSNSANISTDLSASFETPILQNKSKFTSPLSVRSFSTPLADLRSKSNAKTAVQVKLNQLSSKEYYEETERQLKRDILKYQKEIDTMKKIKKYRNSRESQKLEALIDKWRAIAEMGSNYIFNEARMKINRMGGMKKFKEKQKKSKIRKMKFEFDESLLYRIEEYIETEEFKNLDTYEKEEVLSKKKELEEMSEKLERGEFPDNEEEDDDSDTNENNELTMEELYKQLGLDYKLVYEAS